jgi:hypothetical protein
VRVNPTQNPSFAMEKDSDTISEYTHNYTCEFYIAYYVRNMCIYIYINMCRISNSLVLKIKITAMNKVIRFVERLLDKHEDIIT